MKPKIAILASGSGTTAEAFIQACVNGEVNAEVALVISNQKNPGVFERVKKINQTSSLAIECVHIGKSNFPPADGEEVTYGRQTKAEEQAILKIIKDKKIDFVALLGYMKLMGPNIVREYGWLRAYKSVYQSRMINTHPGILPETKGLYGIHVQEYVLINNIGKAGHCLFAVDNEYDDGPVIVEHRVAIKPDDTPETLFERVKLSEKKYLASDIQNFLAKQKEYNQENG